MIHTMAKILSELIGHSLAAYFAIKIYKSSIKEQVRKEYADELTQKVMEDLERRKKETKKKQKRK